MFIADIGINHQGDIEIAKQLIKVAKDAGVDVVKFQKRNPDVCVPDDQKDIVKDTLYGKMKYLEYKHRIEFGKKEYDEIDEYCRELGIKWTASVWDIDSLNFIDQYDVPFIKIPSACITDLQLLRSVNKTNRFVMISTGMSTESEISIAVNMLRNLVAILHCNSSYPCREDEINLKYLRVMGSKYRRLTGYSGHEEGYLPTLVAKSLGAHVLERHITLDKNLQGSDHKSSLDPSELKQLIIDLKRVDVILGDAVKVVHDSELEIMKKLRLK